MKLRGLGKYLTFGLREEWLRGFFQDTENWLVSNSLGNKQLDSMIAWLKDAEIIKNINKKESKINLTVVGEKLANIFISNENITWQIIWINLSYNSDLIKWYLSLPWVQTYSKPELLEYILKSDNSLSKSTANSGLTSLFNMFENSPLGTELKLGIVIKRNRQRYIEKIGTNNVDKKVVLYSLYKYAGHNNKYSLTVSEFYKENSSGGIYKEFGISKSEFENILRSIQEEYPNFLTVELRANLDNIHLNKDFNIESLITKIL